MLVPNMARKTLNTYEKYNLIKKIYLPPPLPLGNIKNSGLSLKLTFKHRRSFRIGKNLK